MRNAASRLTARSATSIAQAQFGPCPEGFCSRHPSTCAKNSSASSSPPPAAYARPNVSRCPSRFSSHSTRTSDPSPRTSRTSPWNPSGQRTPDAGSRSQSTRPPNSRTPYPSTGQRCAATARASSSNPARFDER